MSAPLPLLVAAIGGNALLRRGEPLDIGTQRRNVAVACAALAEMAEGVRLAIVHGNGPQVGLLALETLGGPSPMPLDVLDAESQGQIGHLLARELGDVIQPRPVVCLVTHVEVDTTDPAFARPTKPIGPTYDRITAERLARERSWTVAADGEHWRRVVASPEPRGIEEIEPIGLLLDHDVVVICGGGGGIPVARDEVGRRHGVEAVVDKDLTAALLATTLGADQLLLLTDVDAVYLHWGTDVAKPLRRLGLTDPPGLVAAPGSMGPKVEAARRFARDTGRVAVIGSLDDAARVARLESGTVVGE